MTSKNLVLIVLTLFVTAACGGGGGGSNFSGELTPNVAPLVNAGMDATIRLPENTVSLDGTVSDDGRPASGSVSTSWIVQSGPDGAVFADVNAVDTEITFVNEGTYELQLTASDTELTGSDSVTIIVEAAPALSTITVTPANASLFTNSTQTFSASGADQYGDAFPTNVTWTATGGTINQAGEYVAGTTLGVFDVTATDGAVIGTAGVTITDSPPTADAGGPYAGAEGSVVAVSGAASSDPNDDIVSYEWDLDNDGAYDDAVGVSTNYSATASGVFTIGLQVTDADGAMATDTAEVTVTNVAPTAVAGGPYGGNQATNIALDASASSDPGNDIVTYEWDFDNDGAYDDGNGVMTNFSSTATGVYPVGLLVTDADGATATATTNVTVNNVAPTADAGGPYSSDQGETITLDGSTSSDPGNNIVSYEWDLDNDGAYDDATGATTTFSSDDTGVFTIGLRVTDGDGGSDTAAATVNVGNVGPTADAGGPYSGDQGADIALDGSASSDPGNNIVSYEWDLDNDGAFDDATGVTATFNSNDTGTFTIGLRVTDGEGDTGLATADVTVNNVAPTADAGGPYSGDQAANIALDGSASSDIGNNIVSYEWDLDNDGAFDDATGVTATFNSNDTGTFTIGLRVTDGEGDTGLATADVTVNNVAPTANAGGPYSGDQAANIVLDGSASTDPGNNIVSYEWDLDNDGAYDDATGAGAVFNSTATGVFTIGLQVTDGEGASDTATATVNVGNVGPTADAGGPYSGDQGVNIALDGSASTDPGNNIVSYEWDLDNDGAFDNATGATTTFVSNDTGTFTVGLKVTDGEGDSSTATAVVTVNNVSPTANAGGPYSGDQGTNIALDGSGSSDPGNNITTYEWDLDNDGAYDDATGANTTFTSNATGTFTVGLRVTDGDGGSGTSTATVTVNNVAPTADAGGPYSGGQGDNIILDASGSSDPGGNITLYQWDLDNDGAYDDATGINATFTTTVVGAYTVGLQVTDAEGATDTATTSVDVTNIDPTADAGGPYSGNQGASIALSGLASSDPGNNIVSYEWDLDNDGAYDDATGATTSFAFTATGALTIGLQVTDADGGTGTATATVNVANVAPTADAGGPYADDQGASITLDASGSSDPGSIVSYEWDFDNDASYDDATGVNAVFPSGAAGSFPIGLRVTDDDGATATATATVTIADIGLAAYWRADEGTGTTTADAAGASNGTLVGAGWSTGVSGSALNFNGTSDYVSIDNTAALNITGTAITLSAWIYPTKGNVANGSRIISKRTDAGGTDVYAMLLDQYRLSFRLDGVDMVGPIVRLNDWTHVTMVYNGTDKRIYINGALDATPPQAKGDAIDASTRAVQLGWREGEARYFRGRIDEAQVYDVALTPGQVAALYARDTAPPTPAGLYFSDITVAAGTSGFPVGGRGLAFAEVDNDSLPDLYGTNIGGNASTRELFYRNTDGTAFTEEAAARNIDDVDGGSIGAVFADLDNDTDYDLFNGSTWPEFLTGTGNPENDNVYRNDGLGVFTDVTSSSPDVLGTEIETGAVTALDWDADGDLDLVGVSASALNETMEAYVNNGNFTFSSWAGGGDLATAVADDSVIATDYDGDGDVDILAGNQVDALVILENDGTGSFTNIDPATLGIATLALFDGVTTADVDNDGDLDILLVFDDTGYIYRRDGGSYTLVNAFTGIDGKMVGVADLDNDGFLDLVFAGDARFYRNSGPGVFGSPPQTIPVSQISDPLSIAFADIDGDGDLDFAISAALSRNYLIRNDLDGTGNNWLKVELAWGIAAGQCQAGAFGAKTRVFEAGTTNLVGLREATGNRGFVAQDDPVLHFGLGPRATVDVEVTWIDGTTTTQAGVTANQRLVINACP